MTFRLTKHHGLGNDFLVHLTDDAASVADRSVWAERAQRWCQRHHGVGADGLLLGLRGQPQADLVMTLINADGSLAEMSGNGIRCLAQAEAMRRNQGDGRIEILTDGGPRAVEYRSPISTHAIEASVDMGPARPGPAAGRPLAPSGDAHALGLDALKSVTLDLGNPHLVLLVDDLAAIDLAAAGALHESVFEGGMNVHFVAPTPGERDAIDMRVWERGAGATEACGTGATAVARAAHDWGLVGDQVTVHMSGGDVQVAVGDPMILLGPSVFVAGIVVTA